MWKAFFSPKSSTASTSSVSLASLRRQISLERGPRLLSSPLSHISLSGRFVVARLHKCGHTFFGTAWRGCWAHTMDYDEPEGIRINIRFDKKYHSYISPASYSRHKNFPDVSIKSEFLNQEWRSMVKVGAKQLSGQVSGESEAASRAPLLPFVNALKWKMNQPIEVARGVFVVP
jgi:hypothetical protein